VSQWPVINVKRLETPDLAVVDTNTLIGCLMFCSAVHFCFQVRDEYRTDFDEGRGGYGVTVKQKHQYRPLGRPVP